MKNNQSQLGFLSLLIAALIFASDGVLVTFLAKTLSSALIPLARFGSAMLIVSLILLFTKTKITIQRKNIQDLALFSVSYMIGFSMFTLAIIRAQLVNNAVFMMLCGALLAVMFIGAIKFKEVLTPYKIAVASLAVFGLGFIAYPFKLDFSLLLGFVSGIFFGFANAYRRALGNVNYYAIVFYQSLAAVLIALPILALLSDQNRIFELSPSNYWMVLFYGVSTVVTGLLVTYGFNKIEINLGQIILTSELAFAIVLNLIFLRELPTLTGLLGAGLITLATLLTNSLIEKKLTSALGLS